MLKPGNLDACGAMGTAMIQARRAKVGPDLKWVIDRFAEYVDPVQDAARIACTGCGQLGRVTSVEDAARVFADVPIKALHVAPRR